MQVKAGASRPSSFFGDDSVVRTLLSGIALFLVLVGSSGAAVPTGFRPLSFTAVSERDFWLLGTAQCPRGRCTAIIRTTDGGKSFTRVNAPELPRSGTAPELRFADRSDGFLYVPWRGLFFATHDGGATWRQRVLGPIRGFATGGGHVYVALAQTLSIGRVSVNGGLDRPLPFISDGSPLDLEGHGNELWILGSRRGGGAGHDVLARSNDGGQTFRTGAGPCVPGLGGDLAATSATDVWAVCPTGMLAGAWHSTNGGISFAHLRTPQLVNSAQLAPASASTAVLARGGNTRLLRTTDGGKRWTAAKTPGPFSFVIFVGFTDARVGAALVQAGPTSALWRTTDAGATWSKIQLP